jgi:hypothetical protein
LITLAVVAWLGVPPVNCNCGYTWFPLVMGIALACMAGIIFFYQPGNPGCSPPSDLHKND